MGLLVHRIFGVLCLDRQTFEDVEADASATPHALLIVVVSSLATGYGLARGDLSHLGGLLILTAAALLGWMAWSTLVYLIGVTWLAEPQTRSSRGELLRVTGFAAAPGLVHALAPLSVISAPVLMLGAGWMLTAMVVGVREALDLSSVGRAVAVCLAGWLLAFGFLAVIGFVWPRPVW